jgi:hypothetical protein
MSETDENGEERKEETEEGERERERERESKKYYVVIMLKESDDNCSFSLSSSLVRLLM